MKCLQRISASKFEPNLRNFGLSLSRGVDLDQNNFQDVAVGAKNQVVVIKSKPIVTMGLRLSSPELNLLMNTTSFIVDYCVTLIKGKSILESVKTKIILKLDSRASNNLIERVEDVQRFCRSQTVDLRGGLIDYSYPFKVVLEYSILDCPSCPIVHPDEDKSTTLLIPYVTDCGMDNICQTDLKLESNFENNL